MTPRTVPLGRGRQLELDSGPAVMAVLNVTPDSFSDGGKLASLDAVVRAGRRARREGAAILDVGGESNRPLAAVVDVDEELRRVVPAIRALAERVGLPISVDTRRAGVFREAYAAGAGMLNDVSALRFDPELGKAAAGTDAAVLLMHARGTPETMDSLAVYDDVVDEVAAELYEAVVRAENSGVRRDSILVDPGLGFAKTAGQNFELVRRAGELRRLGRPVVVGPSRKRFLGAATGRTRPADRDVATAVVVAELARAGVDLVRVHAVRPAIDAVRVAAALQARGEGAR